MPSNQSSLKDHLDYMADVFKQQQQHDKNAAQNQGDQQQIESAPPPSYIFGLAEETGVLKNDYSRERERRAHSRSSVNTHTVRTWYLCPPRRWSL